MHRGCRDSAGRLLMPQKLHTTEWHCHEGSRIMKVKLAIHNYAMANFSAWQPWKARVIMAQSACLRSVILQPWMWLSCDHIIVATSFISPDYEILQDVLPIVSIECSFKSTNDLKPRFPWTHALASWPRGDRSTIQYLFSTL